MRPRHAVSMSQPPTKIRRHRKPQPTDSALRKLRLNRSLSLEVAGALSLGPVVHCHGCAQRRRRKWAMALRGSNVDPADVMFGGERPRVPIVGYIGAGAEILPIDDFPGPGPRRGALPQRPQPRARWRRSCAALDGAGDQRVFYSRDPEQDVAGAVGKLCVVKIADGPTMLKQVRRGARRPLQPDLDQRPARTRRSTGLTGAPHAGAG